MLGALWFATACGGTERGAAPGVDVERDPGLELVGGAPMDGVQVGGGQTSDFGDGVESACDYAIETVSREAARAEGWPIDADLALLQPLAEVGLQRQGAGCEGELEAAGSLHLEVELLEIHLARGTPIPEAAGRVECEPLLTYGIDFGVHAGDGWITGQFHVELTSDGQRLQGSGVQSAEQMQGTLRLHVDQRRPHLARANLALAFTRSELSGELSTVVYYTDRREPLLQLGERLFWPPVPGARCADAAPLDDGSGSEWLSLDAYREALRAP
jgi:hypothetical protein